MKTRIVVLTVLLLLAGCGGDGSSDSGGAPLAGGAPVDFAKLAGDYAGSASIRVSSLVASDTVSEQVTATITSTGAISIRFGDAAIARGQLARDGTFRISDTLANAGLGQCTGTIAIVGSTDGTTIRATITSSGARCSGIPAEAEGSLTATRR